MNRENDVEQPPEPSNVPEATPGKPGDKEERAIDVDAAHERSS
ncbi:MAG TPA: hypothetical protein VGB70_05890 [Allosphingosinicella sp.]